MSKCWIYHETEEPKIIEADDAQSFHDDGWADTPAKFMKFEDLGVDLDNDVQVQQAGEAVEGVKDMVNGALNLQEMNKDDLEDYAKKHFGVDLDKRRSPGNLVKQIEELIG